MRGMTLALSVCLVLALAASSFAVTVNVFPTSDANAMVNALIGTGITVVPGSAVYTGADGASGFFTGGVAAGVGIEKGLILTSGKADYVKGPNDSSGKGYSNGTPGSALLNTISGKTTYDAAVLSFDFTVPNGSSVYFNYTFGSEEYNEWVGSSFNDVFGWVLDGKNIALIPGTDIPVTINSVNNGSNSGYYRDNTNGGLDLQYDGFTTVLVAKGIDLSGDVHHMELALADASDSILDSGAFIQANSFSIDPPGQVPEPASLVVWSLLAVAALFGWRRLRG